MEEARRTRRTNALLSSFNIELTRAQALTQAKRLAVLQHPDRQRIIQLLERYPDQLYVVEIASVLGIAYSAACYHLYKLAGANLVTKEWYEHRLYYQLNIQALAEHREAVKTV